MGKGRAVSVSGGGGGSGKEEEEGNEKRPRGLDFFFLGTEHMTLRKNNSKQKTNVSVRHIALWFDA
jgi:hypothetical protein